MDDGISNYKKEVENWMINHRGVRVSQFAIGEIFRRSATMDIAQKGFEVNGLWPFNDTKFDSS